MFLDKLHEEADFIQVQKYELFNFDQNKIFLKFSSVIFKNCNFISF